MAKCGRPPLFVVDHRGVEVVGLSALETKDRDGNTSGYRLYATFTKPRKWFGYFPPSRRDENRRIIANPAGIFAFRRWEAESLIMRSKKAVETANRLRGEMRNLLKLFAESRSKCPQNAQHPGQRLPHSLAKSSTC